MPLKNNHKVKAELITPQLNENLFAFKEAKKIGKCEYSKAKSVEQTPKRLKQPLPQKLRKDKEEACFKKFFETYRKPHINLSLLDVW